MSSETVKSLNNNVMQPQRSTNSSSPNNNNNNNVVVNNGLDDADCCEVNIVPSKRSHPILIACLCLCLISMEGAKDKTVKIDATMNTLVSWYDMPTIDYIISL
jgi:hypothetical protein